MHVTLGQGFPQHCQGVGSELLEPAHGNAERFGCFTAAASFAIPELHQKPFPGREFSNGPGHILVEEAAVHVNLEWRDGSASRQLACLIQGHVLRHAPPPQNRASLVVGRPGEVGGAVPTGRRSLPESCCKLAEDVAHSVVRVVTILQDAQSRAVHRASVSAECAVQLARGALPLGG
jgi:hypothetical protein